MKAFRIMAAAGVVLLPGCNEAPAGPAQAVETGPPAEPCAVYLGNWSRDMPGVTAALHVDIVKDGARFVVKVRDGDGDKRPNVRPGTCQNGMLEVEGSLIGYSETEKTMNWGGNVFRRKAGELSRR